MIFRYTKFTLYMRNLKNPLLTHVFQLHNIHYPFSILSLPTQIQYIFCTDKPALKASFKYFRYTNNYLILLSAFVFHNIFFRLRNEEKIDSTLLMDDSAYRGTIGGMFATSLGTILIFINIIR